MASDSRARGREILSKHFLLRHLTPPELDQILAFARTRRYGTGEILFQKGDPGDGLLAILGGRIRISALSEDGREVVFNLLGPGDLFGEIALLDGKERTANATAVEPSELLVIGRSDFMPFIQSRPDLCTRLLAVLCERVRWVSDLYEDAVFLNLPARLAKRLLRLAATNGERTAAGTRITIKLSQQELGNYMGTTRESINKHLRAWQNDGIIAIERGHIVIREPETLELITSAL